MKKEEILKKIEELKAFIDTPDKPTAKEWLKAFIQKPFDKVLVNIESKTITYYRNGQWLFQQDLKNRYLRCYYPIVWQFFEREYDMDYEQIQELHSDVVVEALNCKGLTPLSLAPGIFL